MTLDDRLRTGGALAELTDALYLPSDADDLAIARALMQQVAAHHPPTLDGASNARASDSASTTDLGLLARLSVTPDVAPKEDNTSEIRIETIENANTLLAITSAGTYLQRRVAYERLTLLMQQGSIVDGDLQTVAEAVTDERERGAELGRELTRLRASFPGARGRESRTELEHAATLVSNLDKAIHVFWNDGEREPLRALAAVDLAHLGTHLRDASDSVAMHVCACLESDDGYEIASYAANNSHNSHNSRGSTRELPEPNKTSAFRPGLLSALVFCGDARIVPSLVGLLGSRTTILVAEAARALGFTEDPRVLPALRLAFDRSISELERTVIAGALGQQGDDRGVLYLRQVLSAPTPKLIGPCLEAIECMVNKDDAEALLSVLHDDTLANVDRVLAIRALGQTGALSAAEYLAKLMSTSGTGSAILAEAELSLTTLRAQLSLRGETAPTVQRAIVRPIAPQLQGRLGRGIARLDFALAQLNASLGRTRVAEAYFASAADRDRTWPLPHVVLGRYACKAKRYADAIGFFRGALERDRTFVESQRVWIKHLVTAFLERMDALLKDSQPEIAKGLLAELASLDLRKAPQAYRAEVQRRQQLSRREADRSESRQSVRAMGAARKESP